MGYIGLDVHRNLDKFLQRIPDNILPEEIIKNVKLLSINKKDMAIPFGSFIYRIQKYPGDIDLLEEFIDCCSPDEVITKFEKEIKKIARDIVKARSHYFSEFKAGVNKFFNPYKIGHIEDGLFFINHKYLKKKYDANKKYKFFSPEVADYIYYLLGYPTATQDDYDILFKIFRDKYVLRWSVNEILEGKKKVKDKTTHYISLKSALKEQSAVKIDMITIINGKFVEVTNFYILGYMDRSGKITPINVESFDIEVESLKVAIEQLYYSDLFYSPFKMVKRIYALTRMLNQKDILKKIVPLVSSNISEIYQLKSELDAISILLEKIPSPPMASINNSLENQILRLSKIIQIDDPALEKFARLYKRAVKMSSKKNKLDDVKSIMSNLTKFINFYTIQYLDKVNLNPPPSKILPKEVRYDRTVVRTPREKVEKPQMIYTK